ncbi:hypothetical protein [Marinobacter fonticola]|uniref:hypothetical protein n=1 Tax=Marinobacter fonticola TaxID=2603215 RepID=UPI0011E62129|nr:hypothetical protein [Marinobacter fonticola]
MPEPASIISVIASVVSAAGGAIACIAAFKSAGHAKRAFEESQKADKRFALRQLSLTAHQIVVEVDRIKWLAQGLTAAYKALAVFNNATGNSRVPLMTNEVAKKVRVAEQLGEKAKPFVDVKTALLNGPLEEISDREIAMTQYLTEAIALRGKIEIELADIQAKNATHQEIAIRNANGQ